MESRGRTAYRQRRRPLHIAAALILTLLLLQAAPPAAADDRIALGFEGLPSAPLDLVRASHPLAYFVRRAVTARLTRPHGAGGFGLELADMMTAAQDGRSWSFRLMSVTLHNGKILTCADVQDSLHRCLPAALHETRCRQESALHENWIDIVLSDAASPEQRRLLPMELAACPVYEKASSDLFGDDFGYGTNIVSAGAYAVTAFRTGREYVLTRAVGRALRGKEPLQITLRVFKTPAQGFAALREGSIYAFFTEDAQVLKHAASDPTLEKGVCGSYAVVRRRNFEFQCDPELDVTSLVYIP